MIESDSLHSYPKIYNFGHSSIKDLFAEEVEITSKQDGSQFSFGIFNGELRARSERKQIVIDAPDKMFIPAVETVKKLKDKLTPGWTYRAEFIGKPKHNVLNYDRVPKDYLIIFNINSGHEEYLFYDDMKAEADRLGLECVPLLYYGKVNSLKQLEKLLDIDSILGGCKIEGVVCKNYKRFGTDGKVLMGKLVSPKFKEIHKKDWKVRNPQSKDILNTIKDTFRTEARWQKGIQHLKECGKLENCLRDIGPLIKEIKKDVEEECKEEIKEILWKWAWPHIGRGVTAGLPEWYRDRLIKEQF